MGSQRFFSRMPSAGAAVQRTPFAQQQAAVRSGFSGGNASAQPGASQASAGWRRFGEPAGQRSSGQTSYVPSQRSNPSTAGNWNRFGSPQAAPQRSTAPAYRSAPAPGSRSSSGGGGGHSSGGHSGGHR
jgi:hypothetical protein